jgi:hypothetical protein
MIVVGLLTCSIMFAVFSLETALIIMLIDISKIVFISSIVIFGAQYIDNSL